MHRYSTRRIALVCALLLLPAATCGVGPVVVDLVERVTAIEDWLEVPVGGVLGALSPHRPRSSPPPIPGSIAE